LHGDLRWYFWGKLQTGEQLAKDINLKRKIILEAASVSAITQQLPQAYTALWPRTITSARHRIVKLRFSGNVAHQISAALTKAQFCFKESIELFNDS
jgi:hypothetical protein